jgi:hypothetical protein
MSRFIRRVVSGDFNSGDATPISSLRNSSSRANSVTSSRTATAPNWPSANSVIGTAVSRNRRRYGLSGTALAAQEDDSIGGRGPHGGLEEGRIRRTARLETALALGFDEAILEFTQPAIEDVGGNDPPRGGSDLFGGEWLGEVVHCAELHGFDRRLVGGERSDDDHADSRLATEDLRKQCQPRLRAEPEIEKDHVEPGSLQGVDTTSRGSDMLNPRAIGFQAKSE